MSVKITLGPKLPQTVWVGVVDHKHGSDLFASKTKPGLYKQLADFCREWWAHDGPGSGVEMPADDEECVSQYFEENTDNFYKVDPVVL